MASKRTSVPTMGPLERSAMEVLWADPARALHVREVADQLDGDLAYTTVMTLLVRLTAKGLLTRRRQGSAYVYRPRLSRSECVALSMLHNLQEADDDPDALLRFVGELSDAQRAVLSQILGKGSGQ